MRGGLKAWARAKFGVQQKFNELILVGHKKRYAILTALALFSGLVLMYIYFRELVVITFFIVLGAASLQYNRFIKTSLGIELITLGLVISGKLYGPVAALIVGFVGLFFGELLTGSLQHKTIISFIAIAIISLLTGAFSSMSITAMGIWLIVIYDLIIIPGYLIMGSNPLRTAVFAITHLAFSAWVFTTIAPFVYNILT